MRARVFLDRLWRLSYIGAWTLVAGCRPGRPAPLVPAALPPLARDSARAWSRATLPTRPLSIRFRWRYEDAQALYPGRGTARIAPPDSLRFDYAGPLGLGAGAAVVIGDSVAWADPARSFRMLVPAIPMLWAGLGIVRPPDDQASVFGRSEEAAPRETGSGGSAGRGGAVDWQGEGREGRRIWRLVQAGGVDTLDYVLTAGATRSLAAEWRREGRVIARSVTRYERSRPVGARIVFPEAPARFELTVLGVDTAAVFPAALWGARR